MSLLLLALLPESLFGLMRDSGSCVLAIAEWRYERRYYVQRLTLGRCKQLRHCPDGRSKSFRSQLSKPSPWLPCDVLRFLRERFLRTPGLCYGRGSFHYRQTTFINFSPEIARKYRTVTLKRSHKSSFAMQCSKVLLNCKALDVALWVFTKRWCAPRGWKLNKLYAFWIRHVFGI